MRKKILVVDDNKSVVEVLKLNFDLLGYDVRVAYDGDEAERAILAERPEIVILDVMMPKKNGYAVCRDLKKNAETEKIPVILLTAKNLKEDVYWGYDSGADAYVTKPYEPRQLESLVEQLLKEVEDGRKTVAWTGLPDASRVTEEYQARLDAGAQVLLIEVVLPSSGVETFAQKYGQAKLKDMVHSMAWKIYEAVKENTGAGVVGQRPDDTFVLLIHPSEEEQTKTQMMAALAPLIDGYYSDKDRQDGGISFNDPLTRKAENVPLLRPEWKRTE